MEGMTPTASGRATIERSGSMKPSEVLVSPRGIGLGRRHSHQVAEIDESGNVHLNHMEGHHQHEHAVAGSEHTFETEEYEAFSNFINTVLEGDDFASRHLPLISERGDIFEKVKDGLIFARLINIAAPGTINEKHFNKQEHLNIFQMTENLNVIINACRTLGLHVVNIGAQDVLESKKIAILSLVWQIFRLHLIGDINAAKYPELIVLLDAREKYSELLHWTPDQVLVRWMKYHVEKAGIVVKSAGFAQDFRDPHLFCALLHQLEPHACSLLDPESSKTQELVAEHALKCAAEFGSDSYLTVNDLLHGNPGLLVGFAAQIFKIKCGLDREMEYQAFSVFINQRLGRDNDVKRLLPLNPMTNDLLFNVSDGIILSKLCNLLSAGLIDVNQVLSLSIVDSDDVDEVHRGHVQCIEMIKTKMLNSHLDFDVHDVYPVDIVDGNEGPIIDLLWSIIKPLLLLDVNCTAHPELMGLVNEKRAMETPLLVNNNTSRSSTSAKAGGATPDHDMQSEDLLLLWLNHHLSSSLAFVSAQSDSSSGRTFVSHEPIADLASGLNDPLVFLALLQQLGAYTYHPLPQNVHQLDILEQATLVSQGAARLGAQLFTLPRDICTGCSRLTLCVLATLFHTNTGIHVDDTKVPAAVEPSPLPEENFTLGPVPKKQPAAKPAPAPAPVPAPAPAPAPRVAAPAPAPAPAPSPARAPAPAPAASTPQRRAPPKQHTRTFTPQNRSSFSGHTGGGYGGGGGGGGGFVGTGSNVKNRKRDTDDAQAQTPVKAAVEVPAEPAVEVVKSSKYRIAIVIASAVDCIEEIVTSIVTKLSSRGISHKHVLVVRAEEMEPVHVLVPTVKRALEEAHESVKIVLAVGVNTLANTETSSNKKAPAIAGAPGAAVTSNMRATEAMTSALQLLAKRWPELKSQARNGAVEATPASSTTAGSKTINTPAKTTTTSNSSSDAAAKRMETYAKINSSYKTPSKSISKPIECTGVYEVIVEESSEDNCMLAGTQRGSLNSRSRANSNLSADEVTIIPAFVNCSSLLEIKALVPGYAESWANIVVETARDLGLVGHVKASPVAPSAAAAPSARSPSERAAAGAPSPNSRPPNGVRRSPLRKADSNPITQTDVVRDKSPTNYRRKLNGGQSSVVLG